MQQPMDMTGKTIGEIAKAVEQNTTAVLMLVLWGMLKFDQGRESTDGETVLEYQEAMERQGEDTFPPSQGMIVDGTEKIIVYDGIHTATARHNLNPDEPIPVVVRKGTRTDLDIAVAGANTRHGKKRTNADKRRDVERLLRNPALAARSNRSLALIACVDPKLVEAVRDELAADPDNPVAKPATKTFVRNGKTIPVSGKKTKNAASTDAATAKEEKLDLSTLKKGKSEAGSTNQATTQGKDTGPDAEKVAESINKHIDAKLKTLPEKVRQTAVNKVVEHLKGNYGVVGICCQEQKTFSRREQC